MNAIALFLLIAAPARAGLVTTDGVPSEVSTGWDETPKDADKTWVELPFRDAWGEKRSVWALRSQAFPICAGSGEDCDKIFYDNPIPTYIIQEDTSDTTLVGGKRAILSAFKSVTTKYPGGGGVTFLTAGGLQIRPDSSYTYNNVTYPAKPVGNWVVKTPTKTEVLKASPLDAMVTWQSCGLEPGGSYNGKKYLPVFKRLHPVEIELAFQHANYGQKFTSSADFIKAIQVEAGSADADLYAQNVRKAVYPWAKTTAAAAVPTTPADKFTGIEAKYLVCRMSGMSDTVSEDKFFQGMRDAKDIKVWVKGWREFLKSEFKSYADYAKGLTGAEGPSSASDGYGSHDYAKLLTDLKDRTRKALDGSGQPPAVSVKPTNVVSPRVHQRVEGASDRARDLLKD